MMRREARRQGMAARKGASTGRDMSLTMKSATSPAVMARREFMVVTTDIVLGNMSRGRPLE